MRKLKFHEKKLLKKVDFLNYANEYEDFEKKIIRQFHLQDRDDFRKYMKLCQKIRALVEVLRQLDPTDATRIDLTDQILNKYPTLTILFPHIVHDRLHNAGVIRRKSGLDEIEKLSVPAFARRRLAVVMMHCKMMSNIKEAAMFIEQGHVRVGPNIVTNPAYHVTRSMEDYITWVDTSKIKEKVLKYNDQLDDYDLLN